MVGLSKQCYSIGELIGEGIDGVVGLSKQCIGELIGEGIDGVVGLSKQCFSELIALVRGV